MKKTLFSVLTLSISLLAFSQKVDMELLKNLKPRNIGPAGMSGRITSIDVVESDTDVMYVGSASGGVWKSTSGGIKWEPIFNDQTTASIGAIAIQQSNPSVVWVGTGEGNPRNSLNGGDGVYRSLDAGKTWKKMGLERTRHIHRIIIHPNNPNIIYVGAIGSPWGEHKERGVYKTIDGGKTWKQILFNNIRTGVAEMVMDPSNPNKLIVAMWEHKRDPWFFKSGGAGSGIYVTFDGGDNWEKRTDKDGLPEGDLGRIGLAISPSKPSVVYAHVESKKNALYKSVDGGLKWKKINDGDEIGNRPFYYAEIYVDPINENRVYSIFTYVNVSEDGGKSFSRLMPAYDVSNGIHPDHHAWWIDPSNPNFMMDGNDGGLNITRDRGETWRFVENLPVGQFYHVAVDNDLPYNVYGGMQDNGSWSGPGYVFKAQGIRNHYWQEVSFGDGFDVLPDPENSRYGISTAQQGYAGIYDRQSGYWEMIRPTNPDGEDLRFNWNVGMNRDPFAPKTIYFGSQFVHKSVDGGQTWTIISGDLTTNDKAKQMQHESGGLTMDATGAENYCTIIVMEPSPLQKDLIWVGTDDGNVQITKNGGKSWSNVKANLPDLPNGAWITQIKPSNKQAGEALLIANDYRRFNYEPYAYRTKDFGATWQRIVDGNDVSSYTLSIVEDPKEARLLFLGTDDGLYVSIDAGTNWTKWNSETFPTTNAYDLVIHPREHDLVIGTFGRALWILDDIRPLRELAQAGASALKKNLHVFDPPSAIVASVQQPKGSRFGGDALFNGENRKSGAMLSYVINKPSKEESTAPTSVKSKKRKSKKTTPNIAEPPIKEDSIVYDSIQIEIFKDSELIRALCQKTPEEDGLHRTYWSLDEKGPGAAKRGKTDKKESSFLTVIPGTYKARFTFGDQKDSVEIKVIHDSRFEMSESDIQEKYDALKSLAAKADLRNQAVERIKEGIDIATAIKNDLNEKDKDKFKKQVELSTSTIDSLNSLLNDFIGKEDKRQGITRNPEKSINTYFDIAYYYLNNSLHAPGITEDRMVERFEEKLAKALEMVNTYFKEEWTKYREAVENLDTSPFQEYHDIK